jgi:general secretion pathway protein E
VLNEQLTAAPGIEPGIEPEIEPGPMLYRPNAAAAARRGGYRGRTGIYELVSLDEKMRQLVHSSASEAELEAHVRQSSPSIFSDGARKALAGVTSIDEILKVTRED